MQLLSAPQLIDIPTVSSPQCLLGVIESSKQCEFSIKRQYYLKSENTKITRGHHSHKKLKQLMVCLKGRAVLKFEGPCGKYCFDLDDKKHKGIIVPEGYWREIELFPNTILSILASEKYEEEDYIRDYQEFKSWLEQRNTVHTVPYIAMNRCHEDLKYQMQSVFDNTLKGNTFILGNAVKKFEKNFSNYCETAHAIACGNGLDAITLILKGLNIGAEDEVIVPTNSFIATALAVDNCGARPVFVDCHKDNYSINIDQIKNRISSKTKAIIPVHLYGIPADMDGITRLAKDYGLLVIEDAAQAHGAVYKGKKIGSLGDAAAFSFYPTKNLGALGDGGCITTQNQSLAEKIRLLANYGSKEKYVHELRGTNSRLDTIQAAILDIKLTHLDQWNNTRRKYAEIYLKRLKSISSLSLPVIEPDSIPVWHVFPVRLGAHLRADFITQLNKNGISINIHYPNTIHKSNAYRLEEHYPNAERFSFELISLPLDPYHTEEEIHYVCNIIENIGTKKTKCF